MLIQKSGGWIHLKFDPADWRLVNKSGKKKVLSFLEELKKTIPKDQGRDYDPDLKTWYIHQDYVDQLRDLLQKHFGDKDQLSLEIKEK